jgi:hypothetical protein
VEYPYYVVITFPVALGLAPEHRERQAENLIGMVHALAEMGMAEINAPMPTEVRIGVRGSEDPTFEFSTYFADALHQQFGGEMSALNVADDGTRFTLGDIRRKET